MKYLSEIEESQEDNGDGQRYQLPWLQ
jgi:hypothetical protein